MAEDNHTVWTTDKYGSYDIACGSENIQVRFKHHDNSPGRRYSVLTIPKADGAKFISSDYEPKEIEVRGTVKTSSYATLNDKLDEMKQYFAEETGILEIGIGDDRIRRYFCTPERPLDGVEDDFGNVIGQEWVVNFICYDPFGYGTSTFTASASACDEDGTGGSIFIIGSAEAAPDIEFEIFVNPVDTFYFENTTTGERLTLNGTFAVGQQIFIDTQNLAITSNGESVSNSGVFPTWPPEWNNWTVGVTAATAPSCIDTTISYIPRYL